MNKQRPDATTDLTGCIVKVRFVKNYASARNHVALGRVVAEREHYLLLECRTIHFGKLVRNRSRIEHGATAMRALPWHRIEVLHILDNETDWTSELKVDEDGYISLDDGSETRLLKMTGRRPPRGTSTQDPFVSNPEKESQHV